MVKDGSYGENFRHVIEKIFEEGGNVVATQKHLYDEYFVQGRIYLDRGGNVEWYR